MTGNRPPRQPENPLAEMMRLLSGPPNAQQSPTTSGPRIRTFTFGNPRNGGWGGGATISIGGGPVLGRDPDGFVRDPWREDDNEHAAAGRPGGGGGGIRLGAMGEGRELGPGYVTIEDLLSHFLGSMTGLGTGGTGPMGDYVLSDGKSPKLFPNLYRHFNPLRVTEKEGLDRVLEELMHAAGEHNRPPPASEVVIDGLPRIKLDQATLGMSLPCSASRDATLLKREMHAVDASQYKDCSICLTEFELGQEVIRIPCK